MSLIFLSTLHQYIGDVQPKSTIIHGKVVSFEESLSLKGATVTVKGTGNFTVTQANGSFSLTVQPGDKTLVVSLAEYQTQEVTISTKTDYEIVLKRTVNEVALLENHYFYRSSNSK